MRSSLPSGRESCGKQFMSRDSEVYLRDIVDAIRKIRKYIGKASQTGFFADEKSVDAVLRNLEIVGEAVKHVPAKIRTANPKIPWKKIAGLRDILSHEYFNVNADIVWDVIQNKLQPLERRVRAILRSKHKRPAT
jgi:uncharacterized protein with HEPN domain